MPVGSRGMQRQVAASVRAVQAAAHLAVLQQLPARVDAAVARGEMQRGVVVIVLHEAVRAQLDESVRRGHQALLGGVVQWRAAEHVAVVDEATRVLESENWWNTQHLEIFSEARQHKFEGHFLRIQKSNKNHYNSKRPYWNSTPNGEREKATRVP